jgi:hypothetical protein
LDDVAETKKNRISRERKILDEIFVDLDENMYKLLEPSIQNVAFLRASMADLQDDACANTSEYLHISRRHDDAVKYLARFVPPSVQKDKRLEALRN